MPISRKELNLICVTAHSEKNGVLDKFANKGVKERLQIPAIFEFYTLLESITIDEKSIYIEGLPHDNGYMEGVYFHDDFIIGCLNIEKDTLKYLTFWTTNSVRESKCFNECSGAFLFIFNKVGNTIIPHIYSYFVIDKSTEEIVPILSLDYLEDNRHGLDFVEDAMNYLKENFKMPVRTGVAFDDFIVS